jgi:glucan-binding YG repeat protein
MFGILNGMGQVKITPENTKVYSIKGPDKKDYIIVKKGGKTYVKDIDNNLIIANGYADITYDGSGGFILTGDDNTRGYYFSDNTLIAPKYSDIKLVTGTKYLLVKTFSGKLGYISSNGNEYFVE